MRLQAPRPDTGRFDALTRLLQVALELTTEHDLDRILQIATRGVCDAVGCERASLFVYDDDADELYTRVVTELEISEIRHRADRGIVGWVARNRELLRVPHPPDDERWDRTVDLRTGFRTRNILAAPVLSADGERLLGVLQLLNKAEPFDDFDEQLIRVFGGHVAVALERSRWEQATRLARELQQAMEMGRSIQLGFLPTALPDIAGYEVAVWWQPAEFVSGDYYDWFTWPNHRWGFCIGDVSGHGLAASLIMASVRAMAHVLAKTSTQPDQFVELLRESLDPDLPEGRFLSFLLVELDPVGHQVETVNAGHAPAFHYSLRQQSCTMFPPTRLPLGFPAIPLPAAVHRFPVEPGDWLILGTDGVVEVRNANDEMFTTRRLEQLVHDHRTADAHGMVQAISAAVRQFHGPGAFADDTTLVAIRRKP